MTWTCTEDVAEFRAHAEGFLGEHPAANTVLLTLVHRLAAGQSVGGDPALPPRLGWWRAGPQAPVTAAFVQTPPHALRLSAMAPERAAELALALPEGWSGLSGVAATTAVAEAFAGAWAERFDLTTDVRERLRLYRLGELVLPTVRGRLRAAGPDDHALLVGWWQAFLTEVGIPAFTPVEESVARRTAEGDILVWESDGADEQVRPVSIAAVSPTLAGMSRIGPVYTPPEERGHGYASAVTAGASTLAIARGAQEVLLYTDLANPVSNSIYQKIGYRPVADNLELSFTG
ncbi:GNAT family N-acetyltransferase [Kitasatospora sp. NBC_01302]|uniref:GNAT family N-acetyltransferase n=1 Tax=Kitasatospora sp. NBC_01302 TaxID=2903575 RepID=UPI002E144677|nr:GNAT family N-acetyltransferase [Kitasatospora sp. NBC_01302]